jgi:hypothetical protein
MSSNIVRKSWWWAAALFAAGALLANGEHASAAQPVSQQGSPPENVNNPEVSEEPEEKAKPDEPKEPTGDAQDKGYDRPVGGTHIGEVDVHEVEYEYSPRWWMLEIKFGPYKPAVDSEPGLTGKPYRDVFGCPAGSSCSARWPGTDVMSQVELDFHLWKGHGTLSVGGTIGYFTVDGNALQPEDPEQPYDPENNPYVRSADETVLHYLPLVLQAVYRWDYAARRYHVPVVPYVKAGVVYAFWWIEGPDGDVTRFVAGGGKARGGTFGYQINVGLALELNFLEPSAAKRMDSEIGVNSTYLFCELVHSQVRWASEDRMRLGMPVTFLAGLSWEF